MPQKEGVKKKEIIVNLPGQELRLAVVEDIEALITDVSDPDQVPCWADIWPAAHGWLILSGKRCNFPPGECFGMGAGMGLPGIVCGLKGRTVLSILIPWL